MIVCSRPVIIYDVDVIGAAIVLVLAAAAVGIGAPLLGSTGEHTRQKAAVAAVKQDRDSVIDSLEKARSQVEKLTAVESQIRASLVDSSSMPETLTRIAARAAAHNVTLTQLTPQNPVVWDDLRAVEIRVTASGDAIDLLRMLHGLNVDYRWLQVDAFELLAPRSGATNSTFGCTLRWFARPSERQTADKPT